MNRLYIFFETILLTFFYSGKVKFAPGTFGSILSFVFFLALLYIIKVNYYFLITLTLIITIISIPIITNYEKRTQKHDQGSIVIDEFVGIFITCILTLIFTNNILILSYGLIFFRIFDIWKPGIIGIIDKKMGGGFGVMFDDILAGIFAGISNVILFFILLNLGLT